MLTTIKIDRVSEIIPADSLLVEGDAFTVLQRLPSNYVQCIVTSPPYWGLRDYGIPGQMGLESELQQYINNLVRVLAEARRILRDDGILWLNIGDGYTSGNRGYRATDKKIQPGPWQPDQIHRLD
ncbi:DNA methyltransferase [Syntrophomonas palmitatica]|uniref:DNA methyltransferase n=1 Tax=Syntrophomonas palmitatica TaxID=402877 RepID=UPI000A6E2647